MKKYSETDLSYAAGFIDGEGCFYLGFRNGCNGRRCFPCTITLSQTQEEILLFMQSLFGGKVYPVKSSGKGSQPVWTWSIYGDESDKLVHLIIPFLRIKKKQAVTYLKMRRIIKANAMGKKISADDLAIRISLVERIKMLKGR